MILNKRIVTCGLIAMSSMFLCSKVDASNVITKSSDLNDLFTTWSKASIKDTANAKINDSVTLGDQFSSKSVGMFNNRVSIDGKNHTYSFSDGDSSTSPYYYIDGNKTYTIEGDAKYYKKLNKDGNTDLARVVTNNNGMQVAEKLSLNAKTRSFDHEVTVRNGTKSKLLGQFFGTYLDTMLDDNDGIPIYASGDGGTYIEDDNLKLFNKALSDNIGLIAGHYSAGGILDDKIPVTNQSEGKELVDSGDSALQYQTKEKVSLNVNDTLTYNYSEALYSQDEPDPTWPDGSPSGWKNFAGQDLELLDDPENSLFGDYVFYSDQQAAIYKKFIGEDSLHEGKYHIAVYAKGMGSQVPSLPLKVSLKKDSSSSDSRTLLLANPLSSGKKEDKGYYKVEADVTIAEDETTPLITVENYQGGYIAGIFIDPVDW